MKVFFTASQRGKKYYEKYYNQIFDALKKNNFYLIDDEIVKVSGKEFYDELEKGGRNANISLYKKNLKNLQQADINVFEASLHSLSIGYMINKSIDFNKPTVVFYFKENIPHFLVGIESDKLIISSYDEKNIEKLVTDTLKQAEQIRDKRFNFFINPDLLNYLEREAKRQGVTKSTFIRTLILAHKKKDQNIDL